MDTKKEYIVKLASHLVNENKCMSGPELANHLNRNGFSTSYGTDYEGGRGIYTLIRNIYHDLISLGKSDDAHNIARSFVKEDGSYAYE